MGTERARPFPTNTVEEDGGLEPEYETGLRVEEAVAERLRSPFLPLLSTPFSKLRARV